MEEIKVSEMLQAESINKDDSVMIIQDGVNKKASGSIQTATGTSLSLTSVADTCKVTSNSKNMFDKDNPTPVYYANNASYSILENGIRIIKPASGATTVVFRIMDVSDKVGETFTLKADFTSGGQYIIGLCDVSGGNRIIGTLGTTGGEKITYTIPEITTSSYLAIWLYGDSNTTGNKDYTNIQLEEGSTATSYNPYNTEVKICGKNIFDNSIINNKWIGSGGVITDQTGGSIQKYLCSEGDTFTLSATYDVSHTDNIIGIAFYSADGTLLKRTANNTTLVITETAPANTAYMWAGHYYKMPKTMQLEFGEATSYEPYKADVITLIPNEEKSVFTYDSLTNIISDGSVTIEYNTQSRLLNNDDVLDIVEPVKEYVDEKIEKANIYSTDEMRVGTYLGKPLYRKMVLKTLSANTRLTYTMGSLGINNPDKIIINYGKTTVKFGTAGYSSGSWYVSSTDNGNIYINSGGQLIINNTSSVARDYYICLEYTKTTD